MNLPAINSFDNWSRLEEVWLGDVYPASWYDDLSPEVRDCFYEITEVTQQDLAIIERKLKEMGVIVRRPQYQNKENFLNTARSGSSMLRKPYICPRDYFVTIGNCLYANDTEVINPWQYVLDEYATQSDCQVRDRLCSPNMSLFGANIVRAGRDIYIDLVYDREKNATMAVMTAHFRQQFAHNFTDYRVHLLSNGGHVDGCFALLRPGVILASMYYNDYARTFPGWKIINCSHPEFANDQRARRSGPNFNGKWYLPNISNVQAFNEHVAKHALDWIGDYTETFFEVNCLVVDPQNVLVLGEHDSIFREMEKHGIQAHSVPFRTRTFWDGGMHCLTLDIRRQGARTDHFPQRGADGIFVYNN